MPAHDSINDDRVDMLKWVSERNKHVSLSELAFMLGLSEEGNPDEAIKKDVDIALYEKCVD